MRHFRLVFAALAVLVGAGQANAYGATMGYWRFESANPLSGDPVYDWSWQDYSGRGHSARSTDDCSGSTDVFGPSVPLTGAANVGSMKFPQWYSRTDWAIVDDHDDFDFDRTQSFTVEMWVNFGTDTHVRDKQIMLKGYGPSTWNMWGFDYDSSNQGIKFFLKEASVSTPWLAVTSTEALNDGQWHHVAGVRQIEAVGERIKLYVDGVFQADDYTAITPLDLTNPQDLWIGGADQPHCYGGYLDELRISRAALGPNQFLNAPEPATLLIWSLLAAVAIGCRWYPRKK